MLNEILNILGKMISADVKAHKNNTEVLKDHLLILQNELSSKNEVIKSLIGTQSAASKIVTSHIPIGGLHENRKWT